MSSRHELSAVAAAFNLTEHKLREIFADFVLSDETSAIPATWSEFSRVWETNLGLQGMVEFEKIAIFAASQNI